jgi:serine/threonine protein kinase
VPCLDDDRLAALVAHDADRSAFADLEVHIDSCEPCRKLVAAALAQGTPEPRSREPVIDLSVHGRYVIDALLGRGGMGAVYLARDLELGRQVALKLHRAGGSHDRLRREAIAMAKLAHPNVVIVYEVTSIDEQLCVAMEYVRGDTLRGHLAARPRGWREISALLADAGAGLAAAHAAGIVHRDFKPENVLVGEDGRPRVGDFGLARAEREPEVSGPVTAALVAPVTRTGTLLGTPAYMAPEQLDPTRAPVDARSDQFAFCAVAWEALYGCRPFTGVTVGELGAAIARQAPALSHDAGVPDRARGGGSRSRRASRW